MSRWAEWTVADWIRFEGWKRKVLAAASCSLETMHMVTNALAEVRDNIHNLGITRQVQVAVWSADLVDQVCSTLERSLTEICRDNLYTREGRAVQKEMLSPDVDPVDEDPE